MEEYARTQKEMRIALVHSKCSNLKAQGEKMAKDEKFMMEFICFSAKETISNLKKNKKDDPSFKVVENIIKRYNVNKEGAWSLYRPVFWHLTEQEVIRFENSSWNLHPEYKNPSEEMLNKLVNGVLHAYRDTLSARVEKYYDN